ncbi:hypothetical protein G9C85_12455 [Halorubellus sp. JP-L1]|uniref:hypothetical protein n=1 Tax=Halorubellus sp. JP-L1 TaxID=2715753 RepID=UPI00140C47C0|nr:hypothetical protein [Halorubellus sp. JP-L1]NHN42430.1 hypothetical protein [Halorubellus sp. JP-L1]
MSGRDDDVFDVDDLRRSVGGAWRAVGGQPVVLGVALAVVATALALGVVPHALGAVGADTVDTGSGPNPNPAESGDGARQRYQNYLTNITFLFAPILLPVVAVGVAFAGALRARGSRRTRVGGVALGAFVGVAVGFVAFVAVAHLAYGQAGEGYIVEESSVSLAFGAIAVNALALAAVTAVGSALAGVAGTLVEPEPGSAGVPTRPVDEAVDGDETVGSDEDVVDAASETDGSTERPANVDDAPANDSRDVGGQHGSHTPTYDPDGRNWDGTGEDSS